MFRFSCFHAHVHSKKPKKTVQLSVEAMQKALEDCSQNQTLKDFKDSSSLNSFYLKAQGDAILNGNANHVMASPYIECGWKSDEIDSNYHIRCNINNYNIRCDRGINHSSHIKKSMSLGSGLDTEGRASVGNDSDETIPENSCDGSNNHNGMVVPGGGKDPEITLPNQYQGALPSASLQLSSDMVNNYDSIFSVRETQQSEKEGRENSDESAVESSDHTPHKLPVIVKSNSLPNIGSFGGHYALACLTPQSRSSEDLTVQKLRQKMLIHEVEGGMIHDSEIDYSVLNNEKNNCEYPTKDDYDAYNCVGSAKDWIVPEVNAEKNFHGESPARQWKELPSKDFKIKRIENWVIDLQHCIPEEETSDELSNLVDHQVQRGATVVDNLNAKRLDGKITTGMEAAKKYVSSLSATSTTAQLANLGLVVIPFLSAFVSLRTLNLSGNTIGRITAGALPRRLHILNLSKNSISTIEGLRELTRLRVLDLSYNRIIRIGHGLASCSSLKELYLAGNKISEVEGLHRLLKLNALDMRFNKISTAKSLGQLAANYNSIQAISLEGNPAQKNVGDEQLKKYIQGILPHLAYFNRQSIKAGILKNVADRSTQLGVTADCGIRLEHKNLRKRNHSASARNSCSSSIYDRRNQVVLVTPKPSKSRHVRLPPTGTKTMTVYWQNFYDFGSKLLKFRSDLSMRRSRSEETLAAAV